MEYGGHYSRSARRRDLLVGGKRDRDDGEHDEVPAPPHLTRDVRT
jgi:hypothetical protein